MDARDEVEQAAVARAAALADGDGPRLRALLHEDFRWTTHLGTSLDRSTYVERNTSGTVRWHAQQLGQVEVVVVGDTAVLTAEVTDVVGPRGDNETFRMPMTQVWVRTADGWQCLAGHAGPRREHR